MLLPWKGHAVFLKAAKRVIDRFPDARAFVIGGPPTGGEAYACELRTLAEELGIGPQVIFTGFRPEAAQSKRGDGMRRPTLTEGYPVETPHAPKEVGYGDDDWDRCQ